MKKIVASIFALAFVASMAFAQAVCPAPVDSQYVYVPFPVTITLDGKLDDWANIPRGHVNNRYTTGAETPGEDEDVLWAMASDGKFIYVAAEAIDKTIITGQNGMNYYEEDSIEFYVNYNDKLTQKKLNKKCLQVRILPLDAGKKAATDLTISGGNGAERFGIEGFVFKTDKGWGFEIRFPADKRIEMKHGFTWGTNFQLNGAKAAGGRTTRKTFTPDPNNQSWQDPSVWGKAVMYKVGSTDAPKPNA